MLPKQAILEFIDLYQKDTGVLLTVEVAIPIAQRFFGGMLTLLNFKNPIENQENK